MAIDVGSAADDRDGYTTDAYTVVCTENPANDTGKIDHIEIFIYAAGSPATVDVASFEQVDTNTFTSRGSSGDLTVETGLNTFDAPGDFTAFDINAGDFIGCYTSLGTRVDKTNSGDGYWYDGADRIPCTDELMTALADRTMSLYASGNGGVNVTVEPSAIAITAGVNAPTINYDYVVAIGSALALTGTLNAPIIVTVVDVTVSPDALTLTGTLQSPTVTGVWNITITPDAVSIITDLKTPTITGYDSNGYVLEDGIITIHTEESDVITTHTEESDITTIHTEETPVVTTHTEETPITTVHTEGE